MKLDPCSHVGPEAVENVESEGPDMPDVPELFESANDKLNWTTLCEALDSMAVDVEKLGDVLPELASLDSNFKYLVKSLGWLRTHLLELRRVPPLLKLKDDSVAKPPPTDNSPASPRRSDTSGYDEEFDGNDIFLPSDMYDGNDVFLPSDIYDWLFVTRNLDTVKDVMRLTALTATYEIFDTGVILAQDLEALLAQSFMAKWYENIYETLVEVLKHYARHYQSLARRSKHPGTDIMHELDLTWDTKPTFAPFAYPGTRLRPARNEIRILELRPGVEEEEIHCSLVVVSLDDEPDYEALSYAVRIHPRFYPPWSSTH